MVQMISHYFQTAQMPPKKKTSGVDMAVPADRVVRSRNSTKNSTVTKLDNKEEEEKSMTVTRGRKRKVEEFSSTTRPQSPEIPAPKKPQQNASLNPQRRRGVRRLLANGFESDTEAEVSVVAKKKPVRKAPNVSASTSSVKPVNGTKTRNGEKTAESVEKKISSPKKRKPVAIHPSAEEEDDDSDESDGWEAVEEAKLSSDDDQPGPSTSNPVEITVEISGDSKKKKEFDMQKFLLNQLKKRQKEMAIDIHKVHLLCCLAHGFYLNDVICRNPNFLALAFSNWDFQILKKVFGENFSPNLDVQKLRTLVASIKSRFLVKEEVVGVANASEGFVGVANGVRKSLSSQRCFSYLELVLVMILMLRSLGLDVRLIYNMQPIPVGGVKILKSALSGKKGKKGKKSSVSESPYFKKLKKDSGKSSPKKAKFGRKRKRISSGEDSDSSVGSLPSRSSSEEKRKKRSSEKIGRKKKILPKNSSSNSISIEKSPGQKIKNVKPETPVKNKGETTGKSPDGKKILSVEDDSRLAQPFGAVGVDYWLDVYCSKVKSYIPVHCVTGVVGGFEDCERTASLPVQYVVAFGEEKSAKDVTAKFSANWLTVNRKLQVDVLWWKETLSFFPPPNLLRNVEEEDAIREMLLKRPRPVSLQEFRGHPLYVLQRHLLKYEALYPRNPIPIGEIRGDSIYLRDVVHLLHTKENWLKEGRVIKPNEIPYKEVKRMKRAVPRRKKSNNPNVDLMRTIANQQIPKDEMSGLYGRWQTQDFVPPVAQNGIVPRNQYGNVDMFKPSMLPVGCVHIPIKNIHKVAKKLGIDCASAMTGWDFSGGHCHPVMDGWIVCQEYQETLLDAWNSQQFEIEREEKEAKIKRALDNWRKLLKSLTLRRRLNKKYGISDPDEKKKKRPEPVVVDVDSD